LSALEGHWHWGNASSNFMSMITCWLPSVTLRMKCMGLSRK
jgi:hypothetical protein